MTDILKLSPRAQLALQYVQNNQGVVPRQVSEKLADAFEQNEGKALSLQQLRTALIGQVGYCNDQLFEHATQYAKRCLHGGYRTTVHNHRVIKETAHAWRRPRPNGPTRRDPMEIDTSFDPDGKWFAVGNVGSRVGVDKGEPLLLKLVLREGFAESLCDKDGTLLFEKTSNGLTLKADKRDALIKILQLQEKDPSKRGERLYHQVGEKLDIRVISDTERREMLVDRNETEFEWGDPIVILSFCENNYERARTGRVAPENIERRWFYGNRGGQPNLEFPVTNRGARTKEFGPDHLRQEVAAQDTAHVARNDSRLEVRMSTSDQNIKDTWLDSSSAKAQIDIALRQGFIFQPGANANVKFANSNLRTWIEQDDFSMSGSPFVAGKVKFAGTFQQLLSANVTTTTESVPTDREVVSQPAWKYAFQGWENIQVHGQKFDWGTDLRIDEAILESSKTLVANLQKIPDNPTGAKLQVAFKEGFLKAAEDASVDGWKAVVGYVDPATKKFVSISDPVTFSGEQSSCKRQLKEVTIDDINALDRANTNLEVRLFNPNNIPAQRVVIPFGGVDWRPR